VAGAGEEVGDQIQIYNVGKAGRPKLADDFVRLNGTGRRSQINQTMPNRFWRYPVNEGAIFTRAGSSQYITSK